MKGLNPIVSFTYFFLTVSFTMFLMHPVCLGISLVGAIFCCFGVKTRMRGLWLTFPLMLVTAVVNPLFNHQGVTILGYFPSGNPLTLESVIYGVAAAVMAGSVIFRFFAFNTVITTDKLVYLFGRILPSLSLVFSMTLRFIPRLTGQLRLVSNAQACLCRRGRKASLLERGRQGMRSVSIVTTWVLENAIETADSMKSRGYGLPGRSAFAIFRFDKRDAFLLGFLVISGVYLLIGTQMNGVYFRYFPSMGGWKGGGYTASLLICYFLMSIIPPAIDIA